MSDRVVCSRPGPARIRSASSQIDLPRPRDVAEVRATPRFIELHQAIWGVLREEVLEGLPAAARGMTSTPCGLASRMRYLRVWQVGLLVAVFVVWHLLTKPGLLPAFMFDNDRQAAFFFGEPLKIFGRIWHWFVGNADIYQPSLGHAARDRARLRHRHRARPRCSASGWR